MNKLLVTAFVLWMCIGIFPLQCYETDGMELILGCDILYREGWSLPPVYSYAYWMQPLMTILIVGMKYLIPALSCEQIYCLLSALASFIFLYGCVVLARHITKAKLTTVLIAAMLLPEMYAIAMYPNTAIPAAACFVWALVFLTRKRFLLTGLLLCLAVLFRLDIVIVFPVILPLLWYEGKSILKSIGISTIYGVVVVVASYGLYWLLGADLLHTLDEYGLKNNLGYVEFALSIVGYYSLAYFILLPVGLCVISMQKRWKLLFVILLPIVLTHGLTMGSASKHYLYLSPFVITAGVYALQWIAEKLQGRLALKWAVAVLVVLFMTVSVRKQNLNMPWLQRNPLHQVGIVMPLYAVEHGSARYTIDIGAGYQILTADENMLATGHLFYPWYIRSIKEVMGRWRQQMVSVLDRAPTSNIMTCEWGAFSSVSFELVSKPDGRFYKKTNMPETYMYTISNPKHKLHFWRAVMPGGQATESSQIVSCIDTLSQHFFPGGKYIMAGSNHYGTAHFLNDMAHKNILVKQPGLLYKIVK